MFLWLFWLVMIVFCLIVIFGDWFPFLKGWKTRIANGLAAFGAALTGVLSFLADFEWGTIFRDNPEYAAWAILILGAGNIWLRQVTTTPPGKKG